MIEYIYIYIKVSQKYIHLCNQKTDRWFTPGPPEVALNIIKQTNKKTNQLNCYTALLITKPVIQVEVTVQ